jgi:hypothetical protein
LDTCPSFNRYASIRVQEKDVDCMKHARGIEMKRSCVLNASSYLVGGYSLGSASGFRAWRPTWRGSGTSDEGEMNHCTLCVTTGASPGRLACPSPPVSLKIAPSWSVPHSTHTKRSRYATPHKTKQTSHLINKKNGYYLSLHH